MDNKKIFLLSFLPPALYFIIQLIGENKPGGCSFSYGFMGGGVTNVYYNNTISYINSECANEMIMPIIFYFFTALSLVGFLYSLAKKRNSVCTYFLLHS